jgi:cytoskeletal protein RodZ
VTVGGTLAEARRQAGLTIIQVSADTRIRETVVRAIERDDFTMCGGNFYARGHIRSIARVIGIDPEPLVATYDDEHGGAPQALPAGQAFEPEIPIRFRERRAPNWTAAMAVVLVLVVGYLVVHLFTGHSAHRAQTRAVHQSPAPVLSASPSPHTAAKTRHGQVTVRVKAKRASWLDVRDAKDKALYKGVLAAGAVQEWTAAKRIGIIVGNGGGVVLVVNGKDVGSPGNGGQVVRLSFGPGDPVSG